MGYRDFTRCVRGELASARHETTLQTEGVLIHWTLV